MNFLRWGIPSIWLDTERVFHNLCGSGWEWPWLHILLLLGWDLVVVGRSSGCVWMFHGMGMRVTCGRCRESSNLLVFGFDKPLAIFLWWFWRVHIIWGLSLYFDIVSWYSFLLTRLGLQLCTLIWWWFLVLLGPRLISLCYASLGWCQVVCWLWGFGFWWLYQVVILFDGLLVLCLVRVW